MKTASLSNHNYGIGIDVGKEEMVASCRSSHSGFRGFNQISFPNNSIGFKRFLDHIRKADLPLETPVLLESTGPYHWQIARFLTKQGFDAKVVNPLHTKQALRYSIRKRKTDKIDADHLAMLAYQNYGYGFKDTEELARLKALVRHYWYLKTTKTNNLRHENYLKRYRQIKKYGVSDIINKQIKKLEKEIIESFGKGNDSRYLDSIPGITPIIAATILAELYPLNRFSRVEQIIALSGLDPQVKQSGGKTARYGKLSKRGSVTLRRALFQAAFGTFSRYPFNPYYQSYKDRGLHHTEALNIIARKILKISWSLLRKREIFKVQYIKFNS